MNDKYIEDAYDCFERVSPRVLKLVFMIAGYITEHRAELTDSYVGMIREVGKIWKDKPSMNVDDYINYVLEMTFAYAGRKHYDDLKELTENYVRDN